MTRALFMASTPLHSLWSLAVAAGEFGDVSCALVLIDQREGDRDFIAEAIERLRPAPFVETRRFARIGKKPWQKLTQARVRMKQVMDYARQFQPTCVAVGSDNRAEFHAALAAVPGAFGAYLDDGTASYLEIGEVAVARSAAMRALTNAFRRMLYGVPAERTLYLGGSRAVQQAWVALPERVHAALRQKRVHAIRADWFKLPTVRAVCEEASRLAGLDPASLDGVQLLLAMPHDSLVRAQPGVRTALQEFAQRALASGGKIAIKRHPRSQELLLDLPAERIVEIPQRLPLEILSPLLGGRQVVGLMTSALLYLHLLGDDVRVATLVTPAFEGGEMLKMYREAGITVLG